MVRVLPWSNGDADGPSAASCVCARPELASAARAPLSCARAHTHTLWAGNLGGGWGEARMHARTMEAVTAQVGMREGAIGICNRDMQ